MEVRHEERPAGAGILRFHMANCDDDDNDDYDNNDDGSLSFSHECAVLQMEDTFSKPWDRFIISIIYIRITPEMGILR